MRNLVIIGSGPAGYSAAIYAARAQLELLVIASLAETGGDLTETTDVENFPRFDVGVKGPDLMESVRVQAERFGAELVYDDATMLELDGDVQRSTSTSGGVIEAKAVIVVTGAAYKKLGIPARRSYPATGVLRSATRCDRRASSRRRSRRGVVRARTRTRRRRLGRSVWGRFR